MNAIRRRASIENNKRLSEQHAVIAVTKAIAVVADNLYCIFVCIYLCPPYTHTHRTQNINAMHTNNKNVFIVKFICVRGRLPS